MKRSGQMILTVLRVMIALVFGTMGLLGYLDFLLIKLWDPSYWDYMGAVIDNLLILALNTFFWAVAIAAFPKKKRST